MAWQRWSECLIFSLSSLARSLSCLSHILTDVLSWFALLRRTLAVFRILRRASAACVCLLLPCRFKGDTEHNSNEVFINAEFIVEWVGASTSLSVDDDVLLVVALSAFGACNMLQYARQIF